MFKKKTTHFIAAEVLHKYLRLVIVSDAELWPTRHMNCTIIDPFPRLGEYWVYGAAHVVLTKYRHLIGNVVNIILCVNSPNHFHVPILDLVG